MVGLNPDLVLLANKLTHVHEKIASYAKQIMRLEQQLESVQQKHLVLEDAFREGVEASRAQMIGPCWLILTA